MRRDVFQAIADPTRREIIHLLRAEKLTLNAIAEKFNISRPAVSKHIKILAECGLVEVMQKGRERYCHVRWQPLKQVNDWTNQYRNFWTERLDALGRFLEEETGRKKPRSSKQKK